MRFFTLTLALLLVAYSSYAQKNQEAALDHYNQGLVCVSKRNSSLGFKHFLKAVHLAEEGSDLQLKAIYKVAHYYNYAEPSEQPGVIRLTLQGIAKVIKTNRKDTLAADLFFRAGLAYELDYKPDSAIICFNEARKRYEKFYGKESGLVSDTYQCLGDIYKTVFFDYNKAEAYYERALAIREKLKNDDLNLYLVLRLYSHLAETNRKQRDFEKALVYGLRNIAFSESINYPLKLELAYSNVASTYSEMGNFDNARELYKKAIALNARINQGKKNGDLADHYFGWGQTLQKEGKTQEAIFNYERAVGIYSSLTLKNIKYISCLELLGELYLSLGKPELSKNAFRKGLNLIREYNIEKSGQAAGLYKAMGNYFNHTQQFDSALLYYQYSLKAASRHFQSKKWSDNPDLESIELKDYSYQTFIQKANVLNYLFRTTGKAEYLGSALTCFSLAEKLLVSSRADLDIDDSRWDFFDANFNFYEEVISTLYNAAGAIPDDSLANQAFHYIESSKSKMLADALNEAEFEDSVMASDSLIEFLNKKRRVLHHLNDQYGALSSSLDKDKEKKATIRNSIIDTDRKIQLAEQSINEKYPSYLKIKYQQRLPRLNDLKVFAKREKVTVLEFFWGYKAVFAVAINGDDVLFKKIGLSDTLQQKIQSVLNFLNSSQYSYNAESVMEFAKNSHALYQTLIDPFHSLINGKRLIIIPDGPISQVPFEILTTSPRSSTGKTNFHNLNYLIKTQTVSYSFSSSFLMNQNENSITNPSLLAFGFTGGAPLRSSLKEGDRSEINGSEIELRALSEKFPNGRFYSGKEVTEQKFKAEAAGYDIIHLAVHGRGDTRQNYSASLFFRDPKSSTEDGELHWYELFGMHLNAKLIVISSCESGIGKSYRGEGMLSMANAFAYAGCRNILMGLWKVDDRVSAQLMESFYKYLKSGILADEALAQAKRDYLKNADELTANPKVWASLVAYGNLQIIDVNRFIYFPLFFLGLVLLGLIYLFRKDIRLKWAKLSHRTR